MRKIDYKYAVGTDGQIFNFTTGKVLPVGEPLFLFRAQDDLAHENTRQMSCADAFPTQYKCPRCAGLLDGHVARGDWLLHFECSDCWLAFYLLIEKRLVARPGTKVRQWRAVRTLTQGRLKLSEVQT